MILLDTNIYIYLVSGALDPAVIKEEHICYASITRLEALGFPHITMQEVLMLESLLHEASALDLSTQVIEQAVRLRQMFGMGLADSVIAATALEYDIPLWTHDMKDFSRVPELRLFDPLAAT